MQVDLGRTALADPRRVGLVRREREMLEEYWDRWLETIRPWLRRYAPVKLERGFLTKVTLADRLPDHAVQTLACSPWLALLPVKLEREEWARTGSALRVAPAIDETLFPVLLGDCAACYGPPDAIEKFLLSPLLEKIEVLDWTNVHPIDVLAQALARSPYARNLKVLRSRIPSEDALRAVLVSPHFPQLTELEVNESGTSFLWGAGSDLADNDDPLRHQFLAGS